MKKKLLGIVLCLAMIIGMFPMGVKAAELPATVTITINLDEFKYYKVGISEKDACNRRRHTGKELLGYRW